MLKVIAHFTRSLIFQATLYCFVAVTLTVFLPILLLDKKFSFKLFRFLVKSALFLMRHILRIQCHFENVDIFQKTLKEHGPFIIACKHQSGFETVIFSLLLNDFVIVSKKELFFVPLIGWYMQHMKFIFIDRKNGKGAVTKLLKEGQAAIQQDRPILIFPEGSRSEFGKRGTYHVGVALLYRKLNVPIVPVALNIGSVWQRKSMIKFPGTATIRILPPILPGLDTQDVLQKLEDAIETECILLGDGHEKPPFNLRS